MTDAEARARFLDTTPASARGIVARAFSGKASARGAIKAMCLSCAYFDRAEIADCLVKLCPLHPYRPYQKKARKRAGSARQDEVQATSGVR